MPGALSERNHATRQFHIFIAAKTRNMHKDATGKNAKY